MIQEVQNHGNRLRASPKSLQCLNLSTTSGEQIQFIVQSKIKEVDSLLGIANSQPKQAKAVVETRICRKLSERRLDHSLGIMQSALPPQRFGLLAIFPGTRI